MNKKRLNHFVFFGAICLLLGLNTACTWVKVDEAGSKVAVASAANVSQCEKLGTTTAKVKDNFVGEMKRDPKKVEKELTNTARNEAPLMGGDTIVPVGLPKDGRQTFNVYRCQ
jgi:predicted outer membrane protein